MSDVKSDIQIAREAKMQPINDILAKINVPDESAAFSPMGRHIAKINLEDSATGSSKLKKTSKDNRFNSVVVINTNDADGFIEIYQDIFNIRLALDKVIEHWQKRMLFFRLNKTTIEVIEQEDDLPPGDKMWGLAWDVKDIKKAHQRLLDEGIEVTPIQKGVKEKTLVATVKSHTQNVPTLLIQHLD